MRMKLYHLVIVVSLVLGLLGSTASTHAASAYNAAVLASNPTYYWTFDEPGLADAEEQVNGDPLDVFIPAADADSKVTSTKTAGGVSLGLALDIFGLEPDKLWDTGDLSGDPFEGAWAYEIWINSNDPESYQYIMGSQASNGYNSNTILQFPYADQGKGPRIMIYDWGPLPDVNDVASQTDGWHHWVFVSDGASQEYDVYQDGAFLMTAKTNSREDAFLSPFPARELRAGGWNAGGSIENFTGQIDEFAIYDLNGAEDLAAAGQAIARHYFAGAAVPGDFNADGILTAADIDELTAASGSNSTNLKYDVNLDSQVNGDDVRYWVKQLKKTWIGDADVNLEFNSADFVQAFVAGKYELDVAAVWSEGDWDGSGRFGSADFVAAFVDGGYEQGAPQAGAVRAVPEPGALALLLVGWLGLLNLSRRP